jgi:hypothetical protein
MMIESLVSLMPPPQIAAETPDGSLANVEATIGTRVPDDYKDFICVYGSGRINNIMGIFNPFSERSNINLITQVEQQLMALKTLADDFNEKYP